MTSNRPNTFLSRVFGVNSNLPGTETELANINHLKTSDEESQGLAHESLNHTKNSILHSDDESDSESELDEEESGSYLDRRYSHSYDDDETFDFRDDEVPLSIMVHTKEQEDEDNDKRNTLNNKRKLSPHSITQQYQQHQKHQHHQQRQIRQNSKQIQQQQQTQQQHVPLSAEAQSQQQASPITSQQSSPPKQNAILHKKETPTPRSLEEERIRRDKLGILNPKERAHWKWANVENLDNFLQNVYTYYLGSGYYCILMRKVLDLATLAFVVYFTTYLTSCIDYSKLKLSTSKSLNDIKVDQCFSKVSGFGKFSLWVFFIYFVMKIVQVYFDAKELAEVHNFYKYLLNISDTDLQTISWQAVVRQIMLLKDQNALTSNVSDMKSKNRIDAHDIANRIMRKENYFISLINRDVLDLSLPIPGFNENVLTKTLEWNLQLCIFGTVFNESGQVKQQYLKESMRKEMTEKLKERFMIAGILNIILSPLLVTYFLLLYFFRYFNEYKKNPGSIGSRQYTPFAEWKFREYNELYHIFQRRMNLSVPEASKYVDQFPKEKTVIFLKFVAFISGSFAAVLGLLSIVDPDMFFNFEITEDRTVLFYISVFGTIWAICHSSLPEEYQVYDSETSLKKVAEYTHYLPVHWQGKYHTEEVRGEFCELFSLKALLLIREIASLVMTPFILWFSLPKSADKIVDFFREYSVHVDGLGYVCTFAMFDFEKSKKRRANNRSNEDKMMKSYLYFMDSYGNDQQTQSDDRQDKHEKHKRQDVKINTAVDSWHPQHSLRLDALKRQGNIADRFKNETTSGLTSLGDSYITTLPKPDSNKNTSHEPGVLGLVNQFYKDYQITH